MIAIIAAMDKELDSLLHQVTIVKTEVVADKNIYIGTHLGVDIVIAKSGIGKVNAAITVAILLIRYPVTLVINTGLAGGIMPSEIGDIVIASNVAYSDVDIRAINPELRFGQIEGEPFVVPSEPLFVKYAKEILTKLKIKYRIGTLVSGDQFMTSKASLLPIMENINSVIACEMEGMAVALTCYHFKTPFIIIRGISDVIDSANQIVDYNEISVTIAKKTTDFVIYFVEECQWNK